MILFDNKIKIKWEHNNSYREKWENSKAHLPAN
jgi:hypothetical protein